MDSNDSNAQLGEDPIVIVEKTYQMNKQAINTIVFVGAILLINRRMTRKVIRKDTLIIKDQLIALTRAVEDQSMGLVEVCEGMGELAHVVDIRPKKAWLEFVESLKK